jgi:hypothetical protein
MKTNPTPHAPLDVIGDIHGQFDKLTGLLRALDYRPEADTWKHPEGRRVLYLGDFIDRGPRNRRVLTLVRGMTEAGDALAVMGNHEFNAIAYNTGDGNGGHLRPHTPHNRNQHAATLVDFFNRRGEWDEWVGWMKGLPFHLDLGGLRAVHATWHRGAIEAIGGRNLHDPEFLRASATKGTVEFWAVETLLKGVELRLPNGEAYSDRDGYPRKAIRARWWENAPRGMTYRELIFPHAPTPPETEVPNAALAILPGYGEGEPPVFFGHYWLPPETPLAPLRPNLACLDFSAAKDGPLVAYRWDRERELAPGKFFTSTHHES